MGISRRNPRGNFNWQSRMLKRRAICCGDLDEPFDCGALAPLLNFGGTVICKNKLVPVNADITITNIQPNQAADTFYEWYKGGPGGALVYSSYGPVSTFTLTPVQQLIGTTVFWIVATNQFGCVTEQLLNVYIFNKPAIGTILSQATDPCVPSASPSGFSSNGVINQLNVDPSSNALYYVYKITYGSNSPNPGYVESFTTTATNHPWTNLCQGNYTLDLELWGNVNGAPTLICTAVSSLVRFGLLRLVFDDPANFPVANPSNVADWNAIGFYSSPFASVTVVGATVYLTPTATSSINISGTLPSWNTNLIEITDTGGWVTGVLGVTFSAGAFENTPLLTTVNLQAATFIGWGAFSNSGITIADFPNVLTVDQQAFVLCQSLTDVIMDSVTTIGPSAFGATELLSNIYMPEVLTIGNDAFSGNSAYPLNYSLVSVSFPKATSIGPGAFQKLPALTDVDLPLAIIIGFNAFNDSFDLVNINLPSCIQLGPNASDNGVFGNITGNTINGTFNASLQTNNAGGLDGDLAALNAANTVTFTWV